MKYTNGNKIIEATERAYEVIYKDLGFEPYKEKDEKKETKKSSKSKKKKGDK